MSVDKGSKARRHQRHNFQKVQIFAKTDKEQVDKLLSFISPYKPELQSVDLDSSDEETSENSSLKKSELADSSNLPTELCKENFALKSKYSCGTCSFIGCDLKDMRNHYKLDWHRYNIKRKLQNEKCVTEDQFNEILDDLSSIDGSDSEDELDDANNESNIGRLMNMVNLQPTASEVPKSVQDLTVVDQNSRYKKNVDNSSKTYYRTASGQIFGLNKFLAEVLISETNDDPNTKSRIASPNVLISVIMVSGGHFAAAVFRGEEIVVHKTFHSYTVRAKQGGSQGSRDSKSGTSHPKSAGAGLRRYNEQSFAQHVEDLMKSWSTWLESSKIIFYRAVSSSAQVLFGGKTPSFSKDDLRLKKIPFQTKRPTFAEVKRVFFTLSTIHVYDNEDVFIKLHQNANSKSKENSPKKKQIDRAKSRSPKRRDKEDFGPADCIDDVSLCSTDAESIDELIVTEEVVNLNNLKEHEMNICPSPKKTKRPKPNKPLFTKPSGVVEQIFLLLKANTSDSLSEASKLLASCDSGENSSDSMNINQYINTNDDTLLHLAAEKNFIEVVWDLLKVGCDPCMKNKKGQYPYNCATSRECRDMFRRFMGLYPDKYDYKKAHVPGPLTDEMEAEKAEKKRLQNKLKREKDKQRKMQKKEKEQEMAEKNRFLNLSDREKRAYAAEVRIMEQCKRNKEKPPVLVRCFDCASDITGKVPFEYNHNLFCTTKCLTNHRKKNPVPLPP